MWYGTVTESVSKETLSYLMECPITCTVFQINMDWRTVVGICVIFFIRVLLLISVRIPSKNWHKSSRDPRVKYRQSREKVWQLTNGVNQSESQTSLDNSSHVQWLCDSNQAPWKWLRIWKVELQNSFLFQIYGVSAVHDKLLKNPALTTTIVLIRNALYF